MACFMFWLFAIHTFAVLTISTLAAHSISISILVNNIIISYISVQTRIREAEVRIVVLKCIVSVTPLPPPTSALQCLPHRLTATAEEKQMCSRGAAE